MLAICLAAFSEHPQKDVHQASALVLHQKVAWLESVARVMKDIDCTVHSP